MAGALDNASKASAIIGHCASMMQRIERDGPIINVPFWDFGEGGSDFYSRACAQSYPYYWRSEAQRLADFYPVWRGGARDSIQPPIGLKKERANRGLSGIGAARIRILDGKAFRSFSQILFKAHPVLCFNREKPDKSGKMGSLGICGLLKTIEKPQHIKKKEVSIKKARKTLDAAKVAGYLIREMNNDKRLAIQIS